MTTSNDTESLEIFPLCLSAELSHASHIDYTGLSLLECLSQLDTSVLLQTMLLVLTKFFLKEFEDKRPEKDITLRPVRSV